MAHFLDEVSLSMAWRIVHRLEALLPQQPDRLVHAFHFWRKEDLDPLLNATELHGPLAAFDTEPTAEHPYSLGLLTVARLSLLLEHDPDEFVRHLTSWDSADLVRLLRAASFPKELLHLESSREALGVVGTCAMTKRLILQGEDPLDEPPCGWDHAYYLDTLVEDFCDRLTDEDLIAAGWHHPATLHTPSTC